MNEKYAKITDFLKNNKIAGAIGAFFLFAVIVLLIAVFALYEFVVSVCILIVLEAAMAAMMHKAELWKHGVLLVAQLVVAALVQGVPLVFLCILIYVAALVVLQVIQRSISKRKK